MLKKFEPPALLRTSFTSIINFSLFWTQKRKLAKLEPGATASTTIIIKYTKLYNNLYIILLSLCINYISIYIYIVLVDFLHLFGVNNTLGLGKITLNFGKFPLVLGIFTPIILFLFVSLQMLMFFSVVVVLFGFDEDMKPYSPVVQLDSEVLFEASLPVLQIQVYHLL